MVANSGRNSYKELEYYFTPLTTKQFAEIKIKNLENLIDNWSTERFTDFCKQQFIKCYGEEYVDFQGNDVFVYFPEVTISNSVEQSHVMRDIYLHFVIMATSVSLYAIKRTSYGPVRFLGFWFNWYGIPAVDYVRQYPDRE